MATRARSGAASTRCTCGSRCACCSWCRSFPGAAARRCCTSTCSCCCGFSISLAFFNHAEIGLSVPLAYPCLLYLLVRMLLLASGRGTSPRAAAPAGAGAVAGGRRDLPGRLPRRPQRHQLERDRRRLRGRDRRRPSWCTASTCTATGRTTTPTATPTGRSTTTPTSRSAPIFGWSGTWDDLPAAHAAAIAFDLLTLLGLYFLGRRMRGPTLGVVLAYAWAAYPFTLYVLELQQQRLAGRDARRARAAGDPLGARPRRWRAALAGLTKFAPLALAPLLLRGAERVAAARSLRRVRAGVRR